MYVLRSAARFLRSAVVAIAALTTVVSCGDIHESRARVDVRAASETNAMTATTRAATLRRIRVMQRENAVRLAQIRHDIDTVVWTYAVQQQERDALIAAHEHAEAARSSNSAPALPDAAERSVPSTASAPSGDCQALLARYFGDDLAWAQHVAQRESHCTAAVNNREGCDSSGRTNSHAMGPLQICYPQHLAAFDAVGCNAPLDLECSMKAARYLYNTEGRGPWGG